MAEVMTPDEVVREIERMEQIFVDLFVERVKLKTPVITGKLRDSWDGSVEADGYVISNSQDYAEHLEYGTENIAPVGMVTSTLPESEQLFEQARSKTRLK